MKTLQTRLIYARELRGLTQGELATLAKCSQGAIGNVESGERKTLRNLVLVARALNISADWLFDGKGPKPEKSENLKRGTQANPRTAISERSEPPYDQWTAEAIAILKPLNEAQKAAGVARLKEFVGHLAPPGDGQTLPMAA